LSQLTQGSDLSLNEGQMLDGVSAISRTLAAD
jgi:hypothetical protein